MKYRKCINVTAVCVILLSVIAIIIMLYTDILQPKIEDELPQITNSDPSFVPADYSYDKYALTAMYRQDLSDEQIALYHEIIDAVESHQPKFETSLSAKDANYMVSVVFYNYPLSQKLLSYDTAYSKGAIKFAYNYNETESAKAISNFEITINNIMNAVIEKDDETTEITRHIYDYIVNNVSLDQYSVNSKNNTVCKTVYDVIVKQKGTAHAIASAFEFLLNQADTEITTCKIKDATSAEYWLKIRMPDYYFYNFDPVMEILNPEYSYFGVSDETMELDIIPPYTYCDDNYSYSTPPSCPKNYTAE